ncbi:MAG: YkgJ family cysteine cluster protein [Dehalococcoidales bacterium]|nr:YkgJ family cysteine cluster protein [Dehalococcoidales bacterium]
MGNNPPKKPRCYGCGKCCTTKGHQLTMTQGDYIRWKQQGRKDILYYVWLYDKARGIGDIWINPETEENLKYCPFVRKVGRGKYVCDIEDSKPDVCRAFWCEAAYHVGKRGVLFRGLFGSSQKAKQLGF